MFENLRLQPTFQVSYEDSARQYHLKLVNAEDMVLVTRDDTPLDDMRREYSAYEHTHDFYEIEYILCGFGTQVINGRSYTVQRGDIVFLRPHDIHTYYPDPSCTEFGIINCIFGNFPVLLPSSEEPLPEIVSLDLPSIGEISQIFEKMEKEYTEKSIGYKDALSSYLSLILIKLLRESRRRSAGTAHSVILPILDYIENHYKETDLKACADYLSYSPAYFSKLFKDNVGMTFTQYVNNRKLLEAIRLLAETQLSIDAIAELVGFHNKNHFYRLFKEYAGVTPAAFRANRRHIHRKKEKPAKSGR